MGAATFRERLLSTARKNRSWVCLGLDPNPASLPADSRDAAGVRRFCEGVMERTAGKVCAFKPQSAWFESLGGEGFEVLRHVIEKGRSLGVPVILDGKRGDIGETARAYATAAFDVLKADAVTVNPYMGRDAVDPFAAYADRGVFVLCRTSNPSSKELQDLRVGDEALFERTAKLVSGWDKGQLGIVAGATWPEELANARQLVGDAMPILIPGVGAQGGTVADAARGGNRAGEMAVVNASRSLLFAPDPAAAAEELRASLASALRR